MDKTETRFTVFFEDPFWAALYERISSGRYEVCKITFGAEPKDYEVYAFLLQNFRSLRFSPSLPSDGFKQMPRNPKRVKRMISKEQRSAGTGTKAQQALALMREQNKLERRAVTRSRKEEEKDRRFEEHRTKQKEKQKGH